MKKASQLLLLLLLIVPMPLFAHGGGTLQITNAPVGDCLISVWSAPPSPRVGSALHITVGAAQAADGEPVLDGTVLVSVIGENGEVQIADVAVTTDQSVNKLFYEADLPALPAGTYQFEVTAVCRGAEDVLTFEWVIRPSTNPLFIILPISLGLLVLAVFVVRTWRQRDTAVEPVRKRPAKR